MSREPHEIVAKLRWHADLWRGGSMSEHAFYCDEAADEIEKLRAYSERLEMALRYIMSDATDLDETHDIAKHALATLEQPTSAQVPGGPTCHPGAFWEASSPTTGVSFAVCSICKQPAKT